MTQSQKREPEAKEATVTLDKRGTRLMRLLPEVLENFAVGIGAAVDEVIVTSDPLSLIPICRVVKNDPRLDFNVLRCLSVVDYEDRLEVVYHLFSLSKRHKMVIKTSVSPEQPHVPSIVSIWKGANWFEREGHDLFGVVFTDHPNLSPLLLYEGFEGNPGRKSFPFHEYDEW